MPLADEYVFLLGSVLGEWVALLLSLLAIAALWRFGPWLDARSERQRTLAVGLVILVMGCSTIGVGTNDTLAVNSTLRIVFWLVLMRLLRDRPAILRAVPLLAAVDGVFFLAFSAKLLFRDPSIVPGYMFRMEATVEHLAAALLLPALDFADRFEPSIHSTVLSVIRAIARQASGIVLPGLAAFNYSMFLWLSSQAPGPRKASQASAEARPRSPFRLLGTALVVVLAEWALFEPLGSEMNVPRLRWVGFVATLLPIVGAALAGTAPDRRRLQGQAGILLVLSGASLLVTRPLWANCAWLQIVTGAGILAQAGIVRISRGASGDVSPARFAGLGLLTWAAPVTGVLLALLGLVVSSVLPPQAPLSESRRRLGMARLPGLGGLLAAWLVTFCWIVLALILGLADEVVPETSVLPHPTAVVEPLPEDPWEATRLLCEQRGRRACTWSEVACDAASCEPDDNDATVTTFDCEDGPLCPEDRRWPGPRHQNSLMAFVDEATGWRLISVPIYFYPRGPPEVGAWPRQFLAPSSLDDLRTAAGVELVVFCCDATATDSAPRVEPLVTPGIPEDLPPPLS